MRVLDSAPAQTVVVSVDRDFVLPLPKPYDQNVTLIYGPEPITIRPPPKTSICDKRGTTGDYTKSCDMSPVPPQSIVVLQCPSDDNVWSIIYQSHAWIFTHDDSERGQRLTDGTWYMPEAAPSVG